MVSKDSRVVAGPGQIGIVRQAPFLTLPDPAGLFRTRALRTEALAAGNPFAAFLEFMVVVMRAQDIALVAASPISSSSVGTGTSAKAGRPLLEIDAILASGDWRLVLDALCTNLASAGMPAEAARALHALKARSFEELTTFASRALNRRFSAEEAPEALFLTAALQVDCTRRAAVVDVGEVLPRETGACPVCGAAPVVSFIGAGGDRRGLRFLVCSLCAAAWRHVRIKCTACGNTKGIAYQGIEGHDGPTKAEACPECKAYTKVIYAEKDADAEPLADDLGSIALDVLMADAGSRRHFPNPFLGPG